jgi:hypothetical protein
MVAFDCECGQHLEASTPDELAALVRDHLVAAHPDMPAEEEDLEVLLDEYAYDPAAAAAEE